MYSTHFGLREPPFALAPNPAYAYFSRCHQEALAHLLYGTSEDGGFVQLTGEVGAGKTTLVRTLLEQKLDDVEIALCLNPQLPIEDFLATLCSELGVGLPNEPVAVENFADAMQFLNRSMTLGKTLPLKSRLDALNAYLLHTHAAGRRAVLIIDEAQLLSREVLEQVRLLTNLETTRRKLLRIILVGQPELRVTLARPDLRQLAQRITVRYHLSPLDRYDTYAYIRHRLRVAGGREDLFTPKALRSVYRHSRGVPRLINIVCDRALLGAYTEDERRVSARHVEQAAHEALPEPHPRQRLTLIIGLLILMTLIGIGLWPRYAEPLSMMAQSVAALIIPTGSRKADATTRLPSSPPAITTSSNLASLLPNADEATAQRRLLALWNVSLPSISRNPLCTQVNAYQLRCLTGRSHWDQLRRYNRPALLRFKMTGGTTAPVLLKTLYQDAATLEIGQQTVTLPLAQLAPWWTGDYVLLWRPQISEDLITPGSSGPSVRWLRQQLAFANGQPIPQAPDEYFDATLQEQLQLFQRNQGLQSDGRAGPRTLTILNNLVSSPDDPVLSVPREAPQVR